MLLHPTSLPGRHGIGELGREARRFADLIDSMGLSWWQMLPIGPTGYGDSPYQSPSTFGGNPLLIAFDDLVEEGLMTAAEAADHPPFVDGRVDFDQVIPARSRLLAGVTEAFRSRATAEELSRFDAFVDRHGDVWLHDFALFTAIKRANHLEPWWKWDEGLRLRRPEDLAAARERLAAEIEAVLVEQYLFDSQFARLRRYAQDHEIGFIGDIPIFVAHDSADVWANRSLFHLDDQGMPTVVAGVPPDYFSATGQRWGNPLYDWERHAQDGFAWWKARMRRMLELFDLVRIDHFRGFAASWHIPATEATAVVGEWVSAPGVELFDALTDEFGRMPVIAEDLGVITEDVEALRDRYGFPGMKVLQFGFGTESAHALEEFRTNVVAYTGTHDNDTAVGWWTDPDPRRVPEHAAARALLGIDRRGRGFAHRLMTVLFESVADTTVVPLQDVLELGSDARMNTPGVEAGNWRWRFRWDQIDSADVDWMRSLAIRTGRSG